MRENTLCIVGSAIAMLVSFDALLITVCVAMQHKISVYWTIVAANAFVCLVFYFFHRFLAGGSMDAPDD